MRPVVQKRNNNKGFTLWELLLVLILASILALVFIPTASINTVPFESAMEKLKYDIRYAQWMAMQRKLVYGINFDINADTYSIYQTSVATTITDPQNPAENYTVNYQTNSKFRGVDLFNIAVNGTSRLEFNGRGIPLDANHAVLAAPAVITLRFNGNDSAITVQPSTGRVSE